MFNIKYCDIIYLYKISIYLSFIEVIYFLFNIFMIFFHQNRKKIHKIWCTL